MFSFYNPTIKDQAEPRDQKRMGSTTDKNLLDLILPQGILEYFLLTDFTSSTSEISLYLEEKNMISEEYRINRETFKI